MGIETVEVPPSPKDQKNCVRLPDEIAVEVAGAKDVPFLSQSELAVKLTIGAGNMLSV